MYQLVQELTAGSLQGLLLAIVRRSSYRRFVVSVHGEVAPLPRIALKWVVA